MTGYTTEEVARLLGLSPAQIRSYTRAGFLSPARAGGEFCFAFPDPVLLPAAKGLKAGRNPAAQAPGSLRRLEPQLAPGQGPSELRIPAQGPMRGGAERALGL